MVNKLNILFLANAFKNHFTSLEVIKSIKHGVTCLNDTVNFRFIPIADGGDSSLASIRNCLGGKIINLDVIGPINHKVTTSYLVHNNTAYIELAGICGMSKVNKINSYTALYSHTYGLGQVICDTVKYRPKKIIINLGGSISTDGGSGALSALGLKFYDRHNNQVHHGGCYLRDINFLVNDFFLPGIDFVIACDVTNPLLGKQGTAQVFAAQKGASPDDINILERGLKNYAKLFINEYKIDLTQSPGAGAAGGTGFGLMTALQAKYISGFDYIADLYNLDTLIHEADLVITTEGVLDHQSINGKATGQIAKLCQKLQKDLYIICAYNQITNNFEQLGISAIHTLCTESKPIANFNDLTTAGYNLIRQYVQSKS